MPATVAADLSPYRAEVSSLHKREVMHQGVSTVEISIAELRALVNCSKPHLLGVEIVVSVYPNEQVTISITGDNIQPGAQLLVDEQETGVQGSFQHGVYVYTTSWNDAQHPESIGLLNPDGTVALTTAMTLKSYNEDGNGNSGNGTTRGHGNGNTGGKPGLTPTPHPDPTPRPHPDPTPILTLTDVLTEPAATSCTHPAGICQDHFDLRRPLGSERNPPSNRQIGVLFLKPVTDLWQSPTLPIEQCASFVPLFS